MYSFGTKSKEVLNTIHPDLKIILEVAIKYSHIDFGLTQGYRSVYDQFELFKIGRKYIDGIWQVVDPKSIVTSRDGFRLKSKHNYSPSLAVDIYAYVPERPDLSYDTPHLCVIAGTILGIAKYMYSKNKVNSKILWGANWDNDSMILYDHTLKDTPHFEII